MREVGLVMATYVLIHGAASDSWYWHRVLPELQARAMVIRRYLARK